MMTAAAAAVTAGARLATQRAVHRPLQVSPMNTNIYTADVKRIEL